MRSNKEYYLDILKNDIKQGTQKSSLGVTGCSYMRKI